MYAVRWCDNMRIRLSYGSLTLLGFRNSRLNEIPTTIYAILGDRCRGNCVYCEQRTGGNKLGMVTWYDVPVEEFIERLSKTYGNFYRVCFEVLYYDNFVDELAEITKMIKNVRRDLLVSATVVAISEDDLRKLKSAGLDSLGIGLDAASKRVFDKVKGGKINPEFIWSDFWITMQRAKRYFKEVTAHIIVGLGETDLELYRAFNAIKNLGAKIALFNYVCPGGRRKCGVRAPRYHAIQIMRYLVEKGAGFFDFTDSRLSRIYIPEEYISDIMQGLPFMTSGCIYCNRPYYTEHPLGHMYNYPRRPKPQEIAKIFMEVGKYAELVKIPEGGI